MMSEVVFVDIFYVQFLGVIVFQEVYYKDFDSKQWFENDIFILVDDVLLLVEVKVGVVVIIVLLVFDFGCYV